MTVEAAVDAETETTPESSDDDILRLASIQRRSHDLRTKSSVKAENH